jgi:uncharacterized protein (TIGR03086 family)
MTNLDLFPKAIAESQTRLNAVSADQWTLPTTCEGWDVRALAAHLVSGSRMAIALLNGGSRDDAKACFVGDVLSADPAAEFAAAASEELTLMRSAEMSQVVPHPNMDMPVAQLLQFRVSDYLVHGWDLARSLRTNESLDSDLVSTVWEGIQPMSAMLPHTGVFGTGSSSTVPDTAPLQTRLLDLLGRRP